eukprot:comp16568_c0_seq1/m.14665 comp16568_c0_seq1/g.14665  ORF comp16568_c0_seq1/g.14665 comp16568_c0_seq1/m.14665 type:complete len:238 (-) comp16568_c0_seq1:347-1060(-)
MYKNTFSHSNMEQTCSHKTQTSTTQESHTYMVCKRANTYQRTLQIQKCADVDLGISICRLRGSFYVTDVFPSTKAWVVGLQVGDKLETVNGEEISPFTKTAELMALLRSSEEVELGVRDSPLLCTSIVSCTEQYASERKKLDIGPAVLGFHLHKGKVHSDGSCCIRNNDRIVMVDGEWVLDQTDEKVMKKIAKRVRKHGQVEISSIPDSFAKEVDICIKNRPQAVNYNASNNMLFVF